jgi:hypothetical protein
MPPQQAKRQGKRPVSEEGVWGRKRCGKSSTLPPPDPHESMDLLNTPYLRPNIFEAITPKAPMTIGLPMALTNQGCERTCSSMTSGCCCRA